MNYKFLSISLLLLITACSHKPVPFPNTEKLNANSFVYRENQKNISKNMLDKTEYNIQYVFYTPIDYKNKDLKFWYLLENATEINIFGNSNMAGIFSNYLLLDGINKNIIKITATDNPYINVNLIKKNHK